MAAHKKLTRELVIVVNVNANLENQIVTLEMLKAKFEQCNRRSNVELPDKDLENNTICATMGHPTSRQ